MVNTEFVEKASGKRGNHTRRNQRITILGIALLFTLLFAGAVLLVHAETYNYVTQWGIPGSTDGQFSGPWGVAVDGSGNVYVVDMGNNRVQKFLSDGTYVTQWGSSGSSNGQFSSPYGVAVDGFGNVYVAETGNNRVQKFSVSTDKTIIFTESGLPSGASWTVTFDGTPHASTTGTITFTIADGSYLWSASTTISGESGTQYVTSSASGTMNVPTQTAQSITYTTQYYLTNTLISGSQSSVTASPTADGWYDSGTHVVVVLNNVWGATSTARSNLFTYTVDSSATSVTRANTDTVTLADIVMGAAHSVSDVSKTQYYLTVTGGNGVSYGTASPTGDNWYDSSQSTTVSSNGVYSEGF